MISLARKQEQLLQRKSYLTVWDDSLKATALEALETNDRGILDEFSSRRYLPS